MSLIVTVSAPSTTVGRGLLTVLSSLVAIAVRAIAIIAIVSSFFIFLYFYAHKRLRHLTLGEHKMPDDGPDTPVAYLLYVSC